jgi:RecA-family ATPase
MSEQEMADLAAESAVLASVLESPALVSALMAMPAMAFTTYAHQGIREAIEYLSHAGKPTDHPAVAIRAAASLGGGRRGEVVHNHVIGLVGKATGAPAFYIERVTQLAHAREVRAAAVRLAQVAEESVRLDEPDVLHQGVLRATESLSALAEVDTSDADLPMSLDELLANQHPHDWLVPGLFERTDRLILTGFEGTGKSFLLAQFALTIAAGVHPFRQMMFSGGHRVLVIDCENSERQTERRYRSITGAVDRLRGKHGADPLDQNLIRFVIRPEGIALNDPREVARIERSIASFSPEMVVIGPLYRLHKLDTRDEQAAKELTDVLDRLRVKYHFALIAEAHVAHGSPGQERKLRPTGSSLFLRWPEFGMGLRPAMESDGQEHPDSVNLIAWRGGREVRDWPHKLHHGQTLPWMPDENYHLSAPMR